MESFAQFLYNSVDVAHLHLLMNHVPTVGTIVAIFLLLMGMVRHEAALKHASLEVFFLVALFTLPVYVTGGAAQFEIQDLPDISVALITAHHDAALLAFMWMQITGFVAWVGLWQARRLSRPGAWVSPAVLLLSVVTLAMMARAATMGGEINHPEIRADEVAAVGTGWLTSTAINAWVFEEPTIWPVAEVLHFLGLCLAFGVLLAVNLRLLGAMKRIPFAVVHRLLPWGLLAFGINLATGMLFFIAVPGQYATNGPFYWKILLLMAAGLNFLYLTVIDDTWAIKAGGDARWIDKAMAAASIVVWLGIIYWGRMLPFLGGAY